MITLLDYTQTLKYLAYLGYKGDTTRALTITRSRKEDRELGKVSRTVLNCFIFGRKGSGKVFFFFLFFFLPNNLKFKKKKDKFTSSTY